MIFCKKTIAEADVSALSDGFVFYMMKYVVWPPAILPDIPTDRIYSIPTNNAGCRF